MMWLTKERRRKHQMKWRADEMREKTKKKEEKSGAKRDIQPD